MLKKESKVVVLFGVFVVVVVTFGVFLSSNLFNYFKELGFGKSQIQGDFEINRFNSASEFNEYFNSLNEFNNVSTRQDFARDGKRVLAPALQDRNSVEYSATDVRDIEKKDIVKTDGQNLYFSGESWGWYRNGGNAKVDIAKAFPAEDLEKLSEIERSGDMLLFENSLIIFSDDGLYSYDVSNSSKPKKSWDIKYDERFSFVDVRLIEDEIFLVLNNYEQPSCPYAPISINGKEESISCSNIYFSPDSMESQAMYVIYKLNASDGEIVESLSFLGSAMSTVVHISSENIFVTYNLDANAFDIRSKFTNENKDLFDEKFLEDFNKIEGENLIEYDKNFERFQRRLDNEGKLNFEEEFETRRKKFYEKVIREVKYTGILKIENKDLEIQKTAKVPGLVSNQFSLDEHDDYLRIATTVGDYSWGVDVKVLSDIYILDSKMEVVGKSFRPG
jgi:inhibitor of cysteine peptidase